MSIIRTRLFLGILLVGGNCLPVRAQETLYNGIVLPPAWPPSTPSETTQLPPYLANPPKVIPIDVGRQLFVDDFLVEDTTLTRTHHQGKVHPASPVLTPDKPWEQGGFTPKAAPFSDGVWYDPAEKLFKMWYKAGWYPRPTCYASSQDGLRWEKPMLDVVPGTNIVIPVDGDRRDGTTAWLDLEEKDPARRYKFYQITHYRPGGMADSRSRAFFSADGVHWIKAADSDTKITGERSTLFYNPFRKVWVFIVRNNRGGRHQDYYEDADFAHGTRVYEQRKTSWVHADELDARPLGKACQLYTLDCVAYESLVLGLFSIFRGDPSPDNDIPKWTDVCLGYSRDGFHWARPDRRAFSPISDRSTDWNYGYIQSAGGGCLVVGDLLYFYMSGSSAKIPRNEHRNDGERGFAKVGTGHTGLVTLRRDGFVSMDARAGTGTLTTRPLAFKGRQLFVNLAASQGELRAEVLDAAGKVIPPYTKENCTPVRADKTLAAVTWKGAKDLSAVAGKPARFRFHLRNGSLYAFWVSPDASGASHGYVAAGGPGFTGPIDTVGSK